MPFSFFIDRHDAREGFFEYSGGISAAGIFICLTSNVRVVVVDYTGTYEGDP